MRKEFKGNALPAQLTTAISTASTTLDIDTVTGWPTGVNPFVVTVDRGTASEEKMLCSGLTGNTLTVITRGYDGTTIASHAIGAMVEHTLDADTIDEANRAANFGAIVPFARAGTLTTYTGKTRFRFPADGTIIGWSASVGTAPTGTTTVRLNRNGTSVDTLTIATGTNAAVEDTAAPFPLAVTAGDYLTVDIVDAGAAADLTVFVRYRV